MQLLTGKLPYHDRPRDYLVIRDIMRGVKPGAPVADLPYPPEPHDKIWNLLDRCWSFSADERPRIMEVETELEEHIVS